MCASIFTGVRQRSWGARFTQSVVRGNTGRWYNVTVHYFHFVEEFGVFGDMFEVLCQLSVLQSLVASIKLVHCSVPHARTRAEAMEFLGRARGYGL
jgi:hypothetical protein